MTNYSGKDVKLLEQHSEKEQGIGGGNIQFGGGYFVTHPKSLKRRNIVRSNKKTNSIHSMPYVDETNVVSNPDLTKASTSLVNEVLFRYYAVRVGYAKAFYFSNDHDGFETQQELRRWNKTTPMVKIRSAIFLYWDDVCQFVDKIDNLDEDSSLEFHVEYEGFDSVEEAEVSDSLHHFRKIDIMKMRHKLISPFLVSPNNIWQGLLTRT